MKIISEGMEWCGRVWSDVMEWCGVMWWSDVEWWSGVVEFPFIRDQPDRCDEQIAIFPRWHLWPGRWHCRNSHATGDEGLDQSFSRLLVEAASCNFILVHSPNVDHTEILGGCRRFDTAFQNFHVPYLVFNRYCLDPRNMNWVDLVTSSVSVGYLTSIHQWIHPSINGSNSKLGCWSIDVSMGTLHTYRRCSLPAADVTGRRSLRSAACPWGLGHPPH